MILSTLEFIHKMNKRMIYRFIALLIVSLFTSNLLLAKEINNKKEEKSPIDEIKKEIKERIKEPLKFSNYMSIGFNSSIYQIKLKSPKHTEFDVSPVSTFGISLRLFPNFDPDKEGRINNITIGYSKSYLKYGNKFENVNQLDIEVPIVLGQTERKLDGSLYSSSFSLKINEKEVRFIKWIIYLVYKDYKYKTRLYSDNNQDLWLVPYHNNGDIDPNNNKNIFVLPGGSKYPINTNYIKREIKIELQLNCCFVQKLPLNLFFYL